MAKSAKKKARKKRAYKKRKSVTELVGSSSLKPFEIDINPPPIGKGDKYAGIEFIARVQLTIQKMRPGNAFNMIDGHSSSWVRKQLSKHFPERVFIVVPIPDNENGYRIYLKA